MDNQWAILILQVFLISCLGWAAGSAALNVALNFIRNLIGPQSHTSSSVLSFWLVHAVYLLAVLWLWFSKASLSGFVNDLVILLYFGVVWIIDQRTRLIPNTLSLTGLLVGLASGTFRNGLSVTLVGGLVGFSLCLALYLFGIVFTTLANRWRKKELQEVAFGAADVLLGGVIGLVVGWPLVVNSLLVSVLLAGLFSILYLAIKLLSRSYSFGLAIPYAPFMILGALYSLFLI